MVSGRHPHDGRVGGEDLRCSAMPRTMRGGSFLNHLGNVRTTVRWAANDEEEGANWLGFRCVKEPSPSGR